MWRLTSPEGPARFNPLDSTAPDMALASPRDRQMPSRHVLAPAQRYDRAGHRQPQEQDRRQLVGPSERGVQHVAGDDPGQQDRRFHDDQNSRE